MDYDRAFNDLIVFDSDYDILEASDDLDFSYLEMFEEESLKNSDLREQLITAREELRVARVEIDRLDHALDVCHQGANWYE